MLDGFMLNMIARELEYNCKMLQDAEGKPYVSLTDLLKLLNASSTGEYTMKLVIDQEGSLHIKTEVNPFAQYIKPIFIRL